MGLVLSGGGASASFQVGVLRYLYDVVGITPTVLTGTSAGSILATLLAQADDHEGQRQVLAAVEAQYENLRHPSDMMVELDWFTELQKLAPALELGGAGRRLAPGAADQHSADARLEPVPLEAGRGSTGSAGRRRHPAAPLGHHPFWDTLSVVWSVSRSRPHFEALLRGGRHEQSMYRRGPIFDQLLGSELLDPERVARSATELRIAVVALESGELRYVTGRGELVDRGNRPVPGEEPVALVDAVHASCAIPAIYPPVPLGHEHYVDGSTRESLPVEIALTHLGVTRCYAVNSLPAGVPEDSSYADKDMLAIVLRAAAGIMADEVQLDDVSRARAAGAVLIAPEVDVLGVLEVDPGLLALAKDYGYLRAAEACEQASPEEQRVTRKVVKLRRRIWRVEDELLATRTADEPVEPGPELAALKWQLRDLIAQVPRRRLPADATQWWRRWEQHAVEVDEPAGWVADAPPGPADPRS